MADDETNDSSGSDGVVAGVTPETAKESEEPPEQTQEDDPGQDSPTVTSSPDRD